jgi:hypothetical protein
MKKINVFLILILFGFGVVVQSAQSIPITKAPHLGTGVGTTASKTLGPTHNARLAIAPYAQVVPSNSYTFIGVSHPSLATAHTSIGLVIEAMDMTFTTSASNPIEEARAVVFTIDAGTTHRIFIVDEGHATINSSNAAFTGANTHIIATATGASQFGNIRVTSIGTHPNANTHSGVRYDKGNNTSYNNGANCTAAATTASCIQRFDNLNQLAMWGVVYQESNGAGFSLEFIGDMHDSSASGVAAGADIVGGTKHAHEASSVGMGSGGAGRGIN